MPLLTVAECKSLLGLEDNTYNERIAIMLPLVEQDIAEYCNNWFADTAIYRASGSEFDFVRGSTMTSSTQADYILDAADDFSTAGFRSGMDVVVLGGSNQGYYRLAAVSTDRLTLTSTGEIEDQSQTTYYIWPGKMAIARANWPKSLKPVAAKMVWHLVDEPRKGDVKSESVDDYSVTFAGSNAYPERVIKGLSKYKRAVLV